MIYIDLILYAGETDGTNLCGMHSIASENTQRRRILWASAYVSAYALE